MSNINIFDIIYKYIMGSWFTKIDDSIDEMIFMPPGYDSYVYNELNTEYSKLYILKTKRDHNVPMVQIRPYHNCFPKKYIVFSHGNASDIYSMFTYLRQLSNDLNVGILAYDYVGYGLSREEKPSEQKCYDSIETVINFLLDEYKLDKKNIYLVGQSLGTGIVMDYVSKNEWDTPIIIISPYKSICRVVLDTSCVRPIDKFRTINKLGDITCPVKIFHGENDQLINISHAKEIYENLFDQSFEPVWLPNTDHNDILEKITISHFREVLDY
ncbi:Alpha/beta hydrolase family protein [Acanthamoeba polyphaga moumouvirus]|uniref:Alpha/beta hydrolase family protein n=1 Tax=Acanthamoeba polyphaga moumouvirus TaxID=1269028 RepID=L7RCI6_9VIRU|nr:Alpha/beta hydrolase family protein [Acanthamoeba polyphaga moumouvirus]AGC01951.1 Alpha/beta hydrolase family protein [Acanthamoeba polyphaga moumouvirus]AQN68313.1 alpha/beta hydrolase family protein [Saudi moumouvirus]